jgi:hypothetical protein
VDNVLPPVPRDDWEKHSLEEGDREGKAFAESLRQEVDTHDWIGNLRKMATAPTPAPPAPLAAVRSAVQNVGETVQGAVRSVGQGAEQHRQAIAKAFGDLGDDVVSNFVGIIEKESGGRADAHKNDEIEDSRGIGQVNARAHPHLAEKYDLFDPEQNARAMREIFDTQGYDAWYTASGQLGLRGQKAPSAPQGVRIEDSVPQVAAEPIQEADRPPSTFERPSQFGDPALTTEEAYSACGPAAAVWFAKANGRNPTLREALDVAQQHGWTAEGGMNGIANQAATLDAMGVPYKLDAQATWGRIQQDAVAGNPVIVSTPGHYFTVGAYDRESGRYHVGTSGTDTKGGAEWMTPEEIERRMGAVNGALFVDSPTSIKPSLAVKQADPEQSTDAWIASLRYAGGVQGEQRSMPSFSLEGLKDAAGGFATAAASGIEAVGGALGSAVKQLPGGEMAVDALQESARSAAVERAKPRTADSLAGGGLSTSDVDIAMGISGAGLANVARAAVGKVGAGVVGAATSKLGRMAGTADLADELRAPLEGMAGNIRLGYFPPEVRGAIEKAVGTFNEFAGQRRGVVTDADALKEAAEVGLGRTVDSWLSTPAGKPFKQTEAIALGNTLTRVGQELGEAQTALLAAREAGTASPEMSASVAEKALEFATLVGVRSGAAAEAGRTLRAFRQALTGEGASRDVAIQRAFKQIGGEEKFAEWLINFQALPPTDKLAQFQMVKALYEPSAWDRIQIIRYGSMLSATSTHLTNTIANTVGVLGDAAMKPAYAATDAILSSYTGAERARYAAETVPQFRGMVDGFLTGMKEAGTIITRGVSAEDIGKLEVRRPGFQSGAIEIKGKRLPEKVAGAVDTVIEMPLRMLGAADAVFSGAAKGGHVYALATRKAIKEGLTGDARTARAQEIVRSVSEHPDILESAELAARRTVVQEDRAVSKFITDGRKVPGVKYFLDMALPFVRTPYNIAAQGAGLTPAGLIGVIDAARKGNATEATDRAARAMVGTAAMGVATWMGANGLLTGARPEDQAETSTLPEGWQPWSVRIPSGDGAVYVEYKNLGPWAIPFAIGAVAGEAIKKGQDVPEGTLMRAVKTVAAYMHDQTFLQGLSNITKAIDEPERYAENISEGIASSFVPFGAMQRQIDRALGNAARDPHGALEAILATSPLTSGNVRERLTPMGDPLVPTQTGVGAFVAPAKYGIEGDEPTLRVLRQARVALPEPGKTAEGYPLTEAERRTIQQRTGELLRETVAPLDADDEFREFTLERRGKIVERMRDAAIKKARREVMDGWSDEEFDRRKSVKVKADETRRPMQPVK